MKRAIFLIVFISIRYSVFAPTFYNFQPAGFFIQYDYQKNNSGYTQNQLIEAKQNFLYNQLKHYTTKKEFREKRGLTFCNHFAGRFLLDNYNTLYNLKPLYSTSKDVYTIPIAILYERTCWAIDNELIETVTINEARDRANRGIPVLIISRKYNHMAIMSPSEIGYEIGQAGKGMIL